MKNFTKKTLALFAAVLIYGEGAYGGAESDLQPITDKLLAICDSMNWSNLWSHFEREYSTNAWGGSPKEEGYGTGADDSNLKTADCKAKVRSYMQNAAAVVDNKIARQTGYTDAGTVGKIREQDQAIKVWTTYKNDAIRDLNACNQHVTDAISTFATTKNTLDVLQPKNDLAQKGMLQYKSDLSGCQGQLNSYSDLDKTRMSNIADLQKQLDFANQRLKPCLQQANDGTLTKCQSDYQKSLAQITQLNSQIQSCSINTAGVSDAARANLTNLSDCQNRSNALNAQYYSTCVPQLNDCTAILGGIQSQVSTLQGQVNTLQTRVNAANQDIMAILGPFISANPKNLHVKAYKSCVQENEPGCAANLLSNLKQSGLIK